MGETGVSANREYPVDRVPGSERSFENLIKRETSRDGHYLLRQPLFSRTHRPRHGFYGLVATFGSLSSLLFSRQSAGFCHFDVVTMRPLA